MNNIIKRKWNQNSMVIIEDLQGMAFQAESEGHTFQISGIDSEGNTVALSGTPAGVMLRSDGQDVTLTCSVSGGVVYATLPANAYSVPGRFGLTIFLTSDGQKTAIYAAVGAVGKTSSGTVAPPAGSDVVDLVNAIATAVATIPASYTDLMASVAPTYSSSGLYAVGSYAWHNGKLYSCTTAITSGETWTSGHWTLANLGSDLVDLKSALINRAEYDERAINLGKLTFDDWIRAGVNASTGAIVSATNRICTGKIAVPAYAKNVIIEIQSGYKMMWVAYDKTETRAESSDPSNPWSQTAKTTLKVKDTWGYLAIALSNTSDTTIDTSAVSNIVAYFEYDLPKYNNAAMNAYALSDDISGKIITFNDGGNGAPVEDLNVLLGSSSVSSLDLVVSGKNLFPVSLTTRTISSGGSDCHITVADDGSITVDAPSPSSSGTVLTVGTCYLLAGKYIVSGCDHGQNNFRLQISGSGVSTTYIVNGDTPIIITADGIYKIELILNHTNTGVTFPYTYKPMIRYYLFDDNTFVKCVRKTYTISLGASYSSVTVDVINGIVGSGNAIDKTLVLTEDKDNCIFANSGSISSLVYRVSPDVTKEKTIKNSGNIIEARKLTFNGIETEKHTGGIVSYRSDKEIEVKSLSVAFENKSSISIIHTKRNLIDPNPLICINNRYLKTEDGSYIFNQDGNWCVNFLPVRAGTYWLNYRPSGQTVCFYNASKGWNGELRIGDNLQFEVPDTAYYIGFTFAKTVVDFGGDAQLINAAGNTGYEAYDADVITIPFLDNTGASITVSEGIVEYDGANKQWKLIEISGSSTTTRVLNIEKTVKSYEGFNSFLTDDGTITVEYPANKSYPSYYDSQMENGIKSVHQNMFDAGINGENFLFITDLHWPINAKESPKIVKEVAERTNIGKIICGGDVISGGDVKNEQIEIAMSCVNSIKDNGDFYCLFGNHDSNYYYNNSSAVRWTGNEAYTLIQKPSDRLVAYGNPCYFYFDNPTTKTRFICIDTGVEEPTLSETQTAWIGSTLNSTPEGWHIIILAHIVVTPTNGWFVGMDVEDFQLNPAMVSVYTMLDTFNEEHDTTKVEAVIGGHVHVDINTETEGGIPIVTTDCDCTATFTDNGSGKPNSYLGTRNEQCFDVITINYEAKTIKCVRFGRGSDRTINYGS